MFPKTLQGWLQSVCLLILAVFLSTITFYTLRYAPQIQPILTDVQAVSGSSVSAVQHVNSLTSTLENSLPEVRKGIFLLWKHADRTLGHLDDATAITRAEQAEIAAKTNALLDAGAALLASGKETVDSMRPLTFAATTAVAQINTTVQHVDENLNGQQMQIIMKNAADSSTELTATVKDVRKIADHVEKQIDTPARWWEKLLGFAERAGELKALF